MLIARVNSEYDGDDWKIKNLDVYENFQRPSGLVGVPGAVAPKIVAMEHAFAPEHVLDNMTVLLYGPISCAGKPQQTRNCSLWSCPGENIRSFVQVALVSLVLHFCNMIVI